MIDLNTIDHIDNMVFYNPDDYFNEEKYLEMKEVILNQLRDFNNLGRDFFQDLAPEENIKIKLYEDIIDYTRENYLNIIDKDFALNKAQLEKTALTIYNFICVDSFNIIFPKILEQLNIQNIIQFDKILNKNNNNFIKTAFINNISEIIINLKKLENIDKTITTRDDYKNLINRFGNYLELIDFCDNEKLTENFFRPVLNKYFDQLLWKTL